MRAFRRLNEVSASNEASRGTRCVLNRFFSRSAISLGRTFRPFSVRTFPVKPSGDESHRRHLRRDYLPPSIKADIVEGCHAPATLPESVHARLSARRDPCSLRWPTFSKADAGMGQVLPFGVRTERTIRRIFAAGPVQSARTFRSDIQRITFEALRIARAARSTAMPDGFTPGNFAPDDTIDSAIQRRRYVPQDTATVASPSRTESRWTHIEVSLPWRIDMAGLVQTSGHAARHRESVQRPFRCLRFRDKPLQLVGGRSVQDGVDVQGLPWRQGQCPHGCGPKFATHGVNRYD